MSDTEPRNQHADPAPGPDQPPPDKPDQAAKGDAKPPEGEKKGDKPDGEKPDGDKPPEAKKTSLRDHPLLLIGGVILLIAAIIGGFLYWRHARQFESTDDAYVDGHIVRLAPQVSGVLRTVTVDNNNVVGPGQLLAVVDTATSNARLAQLQAQAVEARSTLANNLAQVSVSAQALRAARTAVRQPQADLVKAEQDLARYRRLQRLEPAAVSGQTLDQAVQAVRSARAARDQARDQAAQSLAQLAASRTQIGTAKAQIAAADAGVRQQAVDVGYGRLVSPIFGYVANRSVNVGSYVAPGQQVMAIIPFDLWITANFKETQLRLMRVGQPVDVRVDALPDIVFHGHVDSFQHGAGQAFGLLPAENATGNFVKVVQRVPVKIVIDGAPLRNWSIGPGMSVVPTVKVR